MRLLVAGCGYVGARLAERRAAAGDTVYALRRSEGAAPRGVAAVRADLTRPETLDALPEIDAAVFAPTPDSRDDSGYARTYVDGARNLAEALRRRSGPVRWIHVSSTSVFEVDDGSWVDETTPCPGEGFRARRLLESEAVAGEHGHQGVVLRLGGIYGPGRDGVIRRVASGEARAKLRYTNRIHRDDAAAAISHLLGVEAVETRYLGVDRDSALEASVLDWIADQIGVPPPPREGEGSPRGKRCSSDRLLASGFAFHFPSYVEGYGALLVERA